MQKDVFFGRLIVDFLEMLEGIDAEAPLEKNKRMYCERMLELLVDVEVRRGYHPHGEYTC